MPAAKKKVESAAKKAADNAVATEIEVKKAGRATARKAKAKTEAVEAKIAEAAEVAEIEAKKVAAKVKRGAKAGTKKAAEVVEAKKAPARRAKLEIVIQSAMGGAITSDEIAARMPKGTVSAYVKVEENKIYWVAKNGETGSVDIW